MADFTALRRTDAAGFAGGERWHVVMQHEAIRILAHQRVDLLFVACGTQRGDYQRLSFTTGEQCRTVGTRQNAGTDRDRTHSAGVAAVDTWLAFEDLRTDDLGFQVEQDAADF